MTAPQSNPSPIERVTYYSTRQCQGECKRRRSLFQFTGDSQVCKNCTRRMAK